MTAVLPASADATPAWLYRGHRCWVRPLAEADIHRLYPLPPVALALLRYRPWLAGLPQAPREAAERLRILAEFEPAVEIEALVMQAPQAQPIGFLSLSSIDRMNLKAEFSAAFFRGRGTRGALEAVHWALATAFGPGGAEKLVFHVEPDNLPALRLLHALQIDREAVLRGEVRTPSGQRADVWRYAMFRHEWLHGHGRQALAQLAPLNSAA